MDAAEVAELLDGPDCDIDIQMIEAKNCIYRRGVALKFGICLKI